jgi:hypothetical protein
MEERAGFDSRQGQRYFLFATASRQALGPTQSPAQGVSGVNWPGREGDYAPPRSAKFKNEWNYTSIPPYRFMAWCLVKHTDNFTLLICAVMFSHFFLILTLDPVTFCQVKWKRSH